MDEVRDLMQIFVRRFGLLNASCCDMCCGEELSLVQCHIIYEIKRQSSPSMQEIAEALGMDITTFSRQIKTLVDKKIVIKTPDSDDRRINILSLSPKGLKMEDNINRIINKNLDQVFAQFTELERDLVLRSIKLLNEAMLKSGKCCSLM